MLPSYGETRRAEEEEEEIEVQRRRENGSEGRNGQDVQREMEFFRFFVFIFYCFIYCFLCQIKSDVFLLNIIKAGEKMGMDGAPSLTNILRHAKKEKNSLKRNATNNKFSLYSLYCDSIHILATVF